MCNEKDLEEKECEESVLYRKKREKLKNATRQTENVMRESLGSIAEFLVRETKTSKEAINTIELIGALSKTEISFSENDEFTIKFQRKKASGKISTNFKSEEKMTKALNEIKALRGFINSRISKAGELGNKKDEIKINIKKVLNRLEEAFVEFSELKGFNLTKM